MEPDSLKSQENVQFAWAGAREQRGLSRHTAGAKPTAKSESGKWAAPTWVRASVRFIRNAAIGLALLALVPVAVVSIAGDSRPFDGSGTRARLADVERMRGLRAPVDESITPMQAGLALHALQSTPRANAAFPMRVPEAYGDRSWYRVELKGSMFTRLNNARTHGLVGSQVLGDVAAGFSSDELTYLRAVAESPVWRDFDRVGSAGQVDIIGGQYVLPFRADAFALAMPGLRYAETKELAYAGLSRAAYYAATGKPEQAQAAIGSVVSFGFALIDNGTTSIDGLIGRVIVDIGVNGLRQLYGATGNQSALEQVPAPLPKDARQGTPLTRTSFPASEHVARLIADASNPGTPRTLRFESMRQLAFSSCSTPSGMLLGPSDEVKAAFDGAKTTLARNASERAYLDLLYEAPHRMHDEYMMSFPPFRLAMGAATVTGKILGNPRVAACTRVALVFD